MTPLCVQDLGISDYCETWILQRKLLENRYADPLTTDKLLVVEHPEVITIGRKFKGPVPEGALSIERGGEATLHNPGQLVFYPILLLQERERDLHWYLRQLEKVVIHTLFGFGIIGVRRADSTGVWVDFGKRKICSIGVAVSRWVTYHGVALNVSNDLTPFQKINPCGFEWTVMTSVEREIGRKVERHRVIEGFCQNFEREFRRTLNCTPSQDLLSLLEHGKKAPTPSL